MQHSAVQNNTEIHKEHQDCHSGGSTSQCSAVQCSTVRGTGNTTNTINTKHDIIMNERKTPRDVTEKN
jgi:hypothetical protein